MNNWTLPAGWTLKAFPNDTYTLTRTDGPRRKDGEPLVGSLVEGEQ